MSGVTAIKLTAKNGKELARLRALEKKVKDYLNKWNGADIPFKMGPGPIDLLLLAHEGFAKQIATLESENSDLRGTISNLEEKIEILDDCNRTLDQELQNVEGELSNLKEEMRGR